MDNIATKLAVLNVLDKILEAMETLEALEPCREKSMVQTKLDEAKMWLKEYPIPSSH